MAGRNTQGIAFKWKARILAVATFLALAVPVLQAGSAEAGSTYNYYYGSGSTGSSSASYTSGR